MTHIVVFTRNTPDTAAKVEVGANGAVTWGTAQLVLNPWDEYSITEAVLQRDAHKGKATVISIGGEAHNDALKQALAIGMDEAIRIESAAEHDALTFATLAAAAVRKLGDVSLIIFGKEFVDSSSDAHIYMTARKLGWHAIGAVSKILALDFAAQTIRVERMIEEGKQVVSTRLPCVISVLKDINEPKSPSFIGIRKASKAAIPVWTAAELGVSLSAPAVQISAYRNLPVRSGTCQIIEGGSDQEKAEKLIDILLKEKAL